MDKNTNYDLALKAIDTSVTLLDVSTISAILQRFPVLQVRASQRLVCDIPRLINVPGKLDMLRTVTDTIGCIVSPCGVVTAECKLCANTLYYAVRDLDERILLLLLKRMLQEKRNCCGCGLFVQTALSEMLLLAGKLPEYVKDTFVTDSVEQCETDIKAWTEVLGLLQREELLKCKAERSLDVGLGASSLVTSEGMRRLHLRTPESNKMHKRPKRNAVPPFLTSRGVTKSRNERLLLLKLATLYAACPAFVAEKIRANNLNSYCAAKLLSLHDSLQSSELCRFTTDDLQGIKFIGSTSFNLSTHSTSKGCSNGSNLNISYCNGRDGKLLNTYKVWMPTTAGVESLVQALQNGHHSIHTILEAWTSAKGTYVSSVDQIMVAGLAHGRVLEDCLGRCLSGKRITNGARSGNGTLDIHDSSALSRVGECFRMLDRASEHGLAYPISFWEQSAKVFGVLQSAFVSLLLHDVRDASVADVKRVIAHSRNITKRLEACVEFQRAEPRTNRAVVQVCECLSVVMKWKDRGRVCCTSWKCCNCMIPNTELMPIPKPDLWFSWVYSVNRGQECGKTKCINKSTISGWLYGNSSWRRQYTFSKLEILHGIVSSLLHETYGEMISEIVEVLVYVLKDGGVRKNIFAEFVTCSAAMISEVELKSDEGVEYRLRLIRARIEGMWSIIGQHSTLRTFDRDRGISSKELGDIEKLILNLAPRLRDIHECVDDMPTFCEFVGVKYRKMKEDVDNFVRVKIISGLVNSELMSENVIATF